MKLSSVIRRGVDFALKPFGAKVATFEELTDYSLHEYDSYEEYVAIQTYHNKRKLDRVWADETTLALVLEEIRAMTPARPLRGLCHGSRNGFEQRFFNAQDGVSAFGTDISDTAPNFPDSVQWDFHEARPDWVRAFDFVYSNSHDQAWNPRGAIGVWLEQLAPGGVLALEHSEAHGPKGASKMDPFGVRPTVLPYVLVDWFGDAIAMRVRHSRKPGVDWPVWLYFIRRATG